MGETQEEEKPSSVPVTIVTGFLGAGKTTLLKHILGKPHGYRMAVVQNELSEEMGIESPLLKDSNGEIFEGIFELPNGCICCNAKDDFVASIDRLLQLQAKFDYILVETTGIADPQPVISSFWVDGELGSRVRLDGVVTVVDSQQLLKCLGTSSTLCSDRDSQRDSDFDLCAALKAVNDHAGGMGDLAGEICRQIAYADVVLVNKVETSDAPKVAQVCDAVREVNADCRICETNYSQVDLSVILNLRAFEASRWTGCMVDTMPCCSTSHLRGHVKSVLVAIERHEADSKDVEGMRPGMLSLRKIYEALAELLWERRAVYRCKGLFAAIDDYSEDARHNKQNAEKTPTPSWRMFSLQGIGEVFEIEPVTVANSSPEYRNKFLFIGKDIDRDHLQLTMENCIQYNFNETSTL